MHEKEQIISNIEIKKSSINIVNNVFSFYGLRALPPHTEPPVQSSSTGRRKELPQKTKNVGKLHYENFPGNLSQD